MSKAKRIKIIVALTLTVLIAASIVISIRLKQRNVETILTVYTNLDYAWRFRLVNDEYSLIEITDNFLENKRKYILVTFTLDKNYIPKEGEVFFYPGPQTQGIVDKFNIYISCHGSLEGYDGTMNPITIEDVATNSDLVNKIIDQLSPDDREEIFLLTHCS